MNKKIFNNAIIILLFIYTNTYAISIKQNTDLKLIESTNNINTNNNISINFSDNNMVYGNAGCNNYFGPYKIKNNYIHINKLASTLMYCQEKMQDEYNFLETIEKTNNYKINNNILELYKDNNLLLKFKE